MSTPSSPDRVAAVKAYNAGVRLALEGNFAAAAERWSEALGHDPALATAARNLAIWSEEAGNAQKAAEHWAQLLKSEPLSTEALIRRATALRTLGKLDDAIDAYERAIGIYPYTRFWYEELAELLDEAGRGEEAERWRKRSTELDADEAEMAFEDGVLQLQEGNLPLAIACFEAIIEELPANLDAWLQLALAREQAEDYDGALTALSTALEMTDTAQAHVLFHRAVFHLRRGNVEAAAMDLELALDQNGDYGRARRLLEDIQRLAGG